MHASIHVLASLAVGRALFPKSSKAAVITTAIAGTISDLDCLSRFWGPASYLNLHRTYTHSIAGALVLSVVTCVILAWAFPRGERGFAARAPEAGSREWAPVRSQGARHGLGDPIFAAAVCAALLHMAMDACQADGIELFWPFRANRVALDWLPNIDPWILALLAASLLLSELLHLVSSEIGAKTKKPHGRLGAIIGLGAVFCYTGARAILHVDAVAGLQARTYHREWPRRVAAFPEGLSLFSWNAVVETDSTLRVLTIQVGPRASFDPESGRTIYKPEASAALDAAGNAPIARRFLSFARFPKATIQTADGGGYRVEFRDLRNAAVQATQDEVAAVVHVDADGTVADQELVWARGLSGR